MALHESKINGTWVQLADISSSIVFSQDSADADVKQKLIQELGDPKEDSQPRGRSSHTLTAAHLSNGKEMLIAFGGEDIPRNAFENAVWVFELTDKSNKEWKRLPTTGSAPHSRLAHSAGMIGDSLWIVGGRDNEKEDLDDVYSLDLLTNTWTRHQTTGEAPIGRSYHAMTIHNKSIYMFSGCTTENGKFKRLNDLYHLDTATLVWEKLPADPENAPRPRGGSNVSYIDGSLYVFGGFAGRELGDLWVYDLEKKTWNEIVDAKGTIPGGRSVACSLPLTNGRLFVFGGEKEESATGHEGAGKYYNDSFIYNTQSNTWQEIESSVKPQPRGWFAASSLDQRVFVFGGYTGNARINDLFELTL